MTKRVPVGVFFALFTISGFAGLIYESIWSHYLKLFLGHAAYAQTLVLAIFMGGMALGSWLVSRYTHRIRQLLRGYAIAEFGIGLLAITFHAVFTALTEWSFLTVIPALGGGGAVDAYKWTLASLLILPASVLLGTTFPLMSAGIIRQYPEDGPRALSMLYFTNSLGAAIGVLASGFYLIEAVGLPGTILTAGILNITLAMVVWGVTKRLPEVPAAPAAPAEPGSKHSPAALRVILLLAFATGAASFIYEISWIRMLTMGLGASTHSFEVMLSAFILGMSLGSYFLRNRIGTIRDDALWLGAIVVAKGLLALYAIWVYGSVLEFIRWVILSTTPTDGGYALMVGSGMVASMLVMFPTAFCAGMTLPLATNALLRRGAGERSIGVIYGMNTLGCIAGAIFTTHIGMELLGLKGLTGLGALLDIAVAVAVVAILGRDWKPARLYAGAAVVAVVAIASFAFADLDRLQMSSGLFRFGIFLDPSQTKLDYYRDGKTATISVTRSGTRKAIRTNGKPDASVEMTDRAHPSADEATMLLAGAIPLAMRPDAEVIANIGFGSGLTTHTLLASPRAKVVDSIEIERAMIEGARAFLPYNARAYEDPRSRIHIEDAKTFFASHNTTYDIIVSEPSNPWVSGVSTLFSEEFYHLVKRHLKDDGLLVQWIQVYEINVDLLGTVFKALGTEFSDYVAYTSNSGDIIIVAVKKGKVPELKADAFGYPLLASSMKELGYGGLFDLQQTRVASRAVLEPLFRQSSYPANSDYFPILDSNAARSRFKKENASELQLLPKHFLPLIPGLEGEQRAPRSEWLGAKGYVSPPRVHGQIAAEGMGVFLAESDPTPRRLGIGGRSFFLIARAGVTDCSIPAQEWFGSVDELFQATVPFLTPAEINSMLAKVAGSRCASRMTPEFEVKLALMHAINERKGAAMRDLALGLLRAQPKRATNEAADLLMTAMVGSILAGDAQRAGVLWEENRGYVPSAYASRMMSRLITAQAGKAPFAR